MNPVMRCGIIFFFVLLMLLAPQRLLHAMDSAPVLRVGCLDVSSFPDGSPERLLFNFAKRYLNEGDTIPSVSPTGDLLSVATEQILPAVNNMIPTINATLVRLNTLLNDKQIDTMLMSLTASTAQLNGMMANLNRTSSSLAPVVSNVEGLTSNLNTFSRQLTAVQLDSMLLALQKTTDQLQQVSAQLRSRDNTAGLLLNDPSLYNRLDSLVGSADKLMRDLKENPKRYVHFSVF